MMVSATALRRPTIPVRNPRVFRAGLLVAAAVLVLLAMPAPWWNITMYAPQYPQGLTATAHLEGLTGDVHEIDELNHYIGMMPLNDAAQLEKALVRYAVPGMAALALLSILAGGFWGWLLRLPLITFPLVFFADLSIWLWYAGNHLDPKAALSSSIKGFTPMPLGTGKIAQFVTVATFDWGFWLALVASVLAVAASLMREPAKGGEG